MGQVRKRDQPGAPTQGVKVGSAPTPPLRRSGWKKWGFRAVALVLGPCLILACIEAALRLIGYGYPTGFFLPATVNGQKAWIQNDRFGWRFFGPALARTPRPMVLSAHKLPDTLRVFIFGESAAYGDPKPEFGLPRVLEVLLRERLPAKKIEIINAAMTGINSHVILPIARDCADHQGDVWVVYMGNNEVVGPFGSGTIFGPTAPSLALVRGSLALKSTRLGQAIGNLLSKTAQTGAEPEEWEGMQMFLGAQVRHDDPRMQVVYAHFARNLADILEAGRKSGAKIIVSTVISNLRNCAPFASQHRLGLTRERLRNWEQEYQAGVQELQAGHPAPALERFERAALIDDHFADLHFRWAHPLALSRKAEARQHFNLARDYDTLRFRADSQINDLIRRTTAGRERDGIFLADGEQALALEASDGITGQESLYEHVHLNFEGNYRLACAIADQVAKALAGDAPEPPQGQQKWLPLPECARRLAWGDWNRCRTLKSVLARIDEPPFTSQLDHVEVQRRLQLQIEELLPALKPEGLRKAAELYTYALAQAPGDWVLHQDYGNLLSKQGNLAASEGCFREVIRLLPRESLGYLQLGMLLLQEEQPQAALEQFEAGLRLAPQSVALLNGSAVALARLGKQDLALELFHQALNIKPLASETHLNLGTALASAGRKSEADQEFLKSLERPPKTAEGRIRLGKMCGAQGWLDAAVTNFIKAVELDPSDATAQFYLGSALTSRGRSAEAQSHLTEAVRLNPEFAPARLGLGIALLQRGFNAAATEQLTEAVRLDPKVIEARLNLALALLRERKPADARVQLEEVLRLEPGNATAKKFLAAALKELNQ